MNTFDTTLESVPWKLGSACLASKLPDFELFVPDFYSLTPDNLEVSLSGAGYKVSWQRFDSNIGGVTDLKVLESTLSAFRQRCAERLFVCNDFCCAAKLGVFMISEGNLVNWVKNYRASNSRGFRLLDGDFFMWSEQFIYIFTHDSCFANIQLSQ